MMKKFIFYITAALVCICILNACDDKGMGDPLATQMKIESSAYNVSIGKTTADTTVATIRWIDIKSPSYKLTLSNSQNDTTVVLPDNSKAAENNIRVMTISDKQILDYLNQMHLTENTTDILKLTIAGTRTDGVADSITATINVTVQNSSIAALSIRKIPKVSYSLLSVKSVPGIKALKRMNRKVQEKPLFTACNFDITVAQKALTNQVNNDLADEKLQTFYRKS
ncbi:MAG: hypothetical protein Q8904_16435 [Bacteroidota bacterium]|nr:hypothetical protein [Bacteroidota bacterium]